MKMNVFEAIERKYTNLGYERVVTAFPETRKYKTERAKTFIKQAKQMDCNDYLFVGKNDIIVLWAEYSEDGKYIIGYEEQRFLQ